MEGKESKTFISSAEALGEGHADKLCDCICDAILDAYLEQDPNASVQIDVSAKSGLICVIGEIKYEPSSNIDIE